LPINLEIINYIVLLIIPVGTYFLLIKKYFKSESLEKIKGKKGKKTTIINNNDTKQMKNEKTIKEEEMELNIYSWKYNI